MVDILHVESGEIDIVHCLARESLSVDEDEHRLSAESREVHVCLLVHGVGEFHSRQNLAEEVAEVGGIGLAYVVAADDQRLHRCAEERLRGARSVTTTWSRVWSASVSAGAICAAVGSDAMRAAVGKSVLSSIIVSPFTVSRDICSLLSASTLRP